MPPHFWLGNRRGWTQGPEHGGSSTLGISSASGYPSQTRGVSCHLYQLCMDELDTVGCFTWDRVPLFRQLNHSLERSRLSLQLGVSPSPLYSSHLKTCNQLPTCLLLKCKMADPEMFFKRGAGLFSKYCHSYSNLL